MMEKRELVDTATTATTVLPATTPYRHSKPSPKKEKKRADHNDEVDIDSSISIDGSAAAGDEGSETVGEKLTAAFDNASTTTTLDDSSYEYHGLLSLLFIAICAGLFIAGMPSQCHCFENMFHEPDDKHQLHGSVKQRMRTFNHWIGGQDKRKSIGNSPSSLKSGLTNKEGVDDDDDLTELGIEVDEKKGIDSKPRRSFGLGIEPKPKRSFGQRLFDAAHIQKLPGSPLRREKKKCRQKKVVKNNKNDDHDVDVSDMYVRAEEQVEFQKV